MFDWMGVIAGVAVLAGVFIGLVWLIKKIQAGNRSYSDKDSGWYNDAG